MQDNNQYRESILLGKFSEEDGEGSRDSDPYGYYAALGIMQSASANDIRQAFLHLSAAYHTDKHIGESEEAQRLMNERFQKLQEAYTVLSDEKQRMAYDSVGTKGSDYLALVPQGVNRHEDITRYLGTLEREAELLRLAKQLSATSLLTVSYNAARLFSSPNNEESASAANGTDNTSAEIDTSPTKREGEGNDDDGGGGGDGDDAKTAAAAASGTLTAGTMVSARVVAIDGREQIVLIPSPQLEKTLRRRMGLSTGGNSDPSSHSQELSGVSRFLNNAYASLVPTKIAFRHTFWHSLTQSLGVTVRTVARQDGSKTYVGCAGVFLYAPNNFFSYAASCRMSLQGVRVTLSHARQLSALWTLRTKLLCFNAFQLLQRYELTLERKLSALWTLSNTLVMSLSGFGSLRTTLMGSTASGLQRYVNAQFGYNQLDIHLLNLSPTVDGDADDADGSDDHDKRGEQRGHVSQTAFVSLFGGYGRIGFEAMRNFGKRQKVGIGFYTTLSLPVRVSGHIPRNPKKSAFNSFTLIYTRGETRIEVPVVLFISSKFQQAVLWLAAPVLFYRVARLMWRPIERSRTAAVYRQRRLQHRTEMDLERVRAMREQRALEGSALRSRLSEESVCGLVIINAKYGVLRPCYPESLCSSTGEASWPLSWWRRWRERGGKGGEGREGREGGDDTQSSFLVLDVTVPLQHLVRNSQLHLPAGSKSKLVGFTDPDPFTSEKKELRIVYWFQQRRHTLTVRDNDAVELPQREHLVFS